MVDTEPVSAYAVYRNLVHVGNKKVNKLRKRKRNNKSGHLLQGATEEHDQPRKKRAMKVKTQWKKSGNLHEVNAVTISKEPIRSISNGGIGGTSMASVNLPTKSCAKRAATLVNLGKRKNRLKQSVNIRTSGTKGKSKKGLKNSSKKFMTSSTFPFNNEDDNLNKDSESNMDDNYDSFSKGQKVFSWLIHPATPEDFFKTAWEKRPLHIKRHISNYYSSLLSTKAVDLMLREHCVLYGKNLDITSYVGGKRETHNPVGRANASVVWDYYSNGCSVRLLNPQTFINPVWDICAALQDVFGCFVGANVYLTPPDSQGFAPHYDDIEAFILQLEGKKHWKLYAPLSAEECLPRFSSGNFTQEEIGEPILDVVLEAGDLLYFPRGVIHQGLTLPNTHSLHLTVSSFQRNTWGDFLEKLIPVALKVAMEEDPSYREGLPRDYLRYMGVAHSDYTSEGRCQFIQKIGELMKRLCEFAPVDATADQLGKQLMHDALPPLLSPEEKKCMVFEDGERLSGGVVANRVEVERSTRIKLLRGNVLRLVTEEDSVRAYHCIENSREYHGVDEPQFIELTAELAPAVEFLIHSYPVFVSVDELPLDNLSDKIQLASDLWERGLVMTEEPLPTSRE